MVSYIIGVVVAASLIAAASAAGAADAFAPSDADLSRVAAMLVPKLGAFCPDVGDRAGWNRVAARTTVKDAIAFIESRK